MSLVRQERLRARAKRFLLATVPFSILGCAIVYGYARWIQHNPEAAWKGAVIFAIAGGFIVLIGLLQIYLQALRTDKNS